jgi:D-alanyl-D-alanine dipeptidase
MGHNHADRLARARRETKAQELNALIVTPGPDLVYLVGYDPPALERITALVMRPGHDPVLLVPELERPRAAASPAGSLLQIATWRDGEDPYDAVCALLPSLGRFGATDQMWAMHLMGLQRALAEVQFVPASTVLARLRVIKDAGEVNLLARAGRGADDAFDRISREQLSGRTEEDVAASLRTHLVEAGHDVAVFWIVGSGPNGASPHHEAGSRTIRVGEPVVLDFGGTVHGYGSDLTRTVSVGEPGQEVRDVHDIVRHAQEAAFQAVRPGVPAEEVDRAARKVIDGAGYGDAFIHRTGHGIGLEAHEAPYIVEGSTEVLEPGMCFSIEPGIYLEGRFGVRIEDIVTVTEEGAVRLNNAPRDLKLVS